MIYVSSACLKNSHIGETLKQLGKAGIHGVELSGGTKYYSGLENDLIEMKRVYGLEYACHSYFPPPEEDFVVNLASCNDEIYYRSINHYFECIEMLHRLRIDVLSIHAGFLFETSPDCLGGLIQPIALYNESDAYKRFVQAYKKIQERCFEYQIRLYLENNVLSLANYRSFGNNNLLMMTDKDTILKMRELLDFDLLLDLAHLRVSCTALGIDFASQCQELIPIAKWFHISENDSLCDLHAPLREGSVLHRMGLEARNTGYNVTLETNGTIRDILESIELLEGV